VIEIEGFANAGNAQFNASGCNSAGTQCGAYNGTFVLDRVADPGFFYEENCLYESEMFTATIPIWTEINNQYCWECENGLVFYRLAFVLDQTGPEAEHGYKSVLSIEREDGISIAYFLPMAPPTVDGDSTPIPPNWAAQMCHQEGITHFEASSGYPLHHGIYNSNYPNFQDPSVLLWGKAFAYGAPSRGIMPQGDDGPAFYPAGVFLGTGLRNRTDEDESEQFPSKVPKRVTDQCNKQTQFDALPRVDGFQQLKVGSPHWICCKDDSFTCDTVAEIASGQAIGKLYPLWRVNSIRCGT
jgi:hypothetical protein